MPETENTRVLDRALLILDILAETEEPLGTTDIARRSTLSKATAFRLLSSLSAANVIIKDGKGLYQMGPAVLTWANAFRKQTGLVELSRPYLKNLWEETSETVHLFVYEKGRGYYLEKLESPHPVRMQSRIGAHLTLYCTSAGRAILSRFSEEEREEYFRETALLPRTNRTDVDPASLRNRILEAGRRGYAEENQENEEGIRCVGAAILDSRGYPAGAISVSAPAYRFGDEVLERYGRLTAETAEEISRQFGRRG
jgi:DNA-binding IclR family transcriptional regulator